MRELQWDCLNRSFIISLIVIGVIMLVIGFSELVVDSSSPNYDVGFRSCTAALTNSYPLNSEGSVNGFLTEVVGITNSSS